MDLVALFREENWEALEIAWTEHVLQSGPLEPVLELLVLASEKKQMPRCVPFVKDHAAALCAAGRHREAADLLGRTMLGGGSPGELSADLYKATEEAYKGEEWWSAYAALAHLELASRDMRAAWKAFRKLIAMKPGTVVFHASGWGVGQISSFDQGLLEVNVQFLGGRKDRFPLGSAVEIFDVLDEDDMRGLLVRDRPELERLLKKEPLHVLRDVVRRYGGRANLSVVKSALAQLGVDGSAFTSWWKRARKAAETSEWFEITGEGTKCSVRLLARAADPADGLRRQLKLARSLAAALSRVRALLEGKAVDERLRAAALETLDELAASDAEPLDERMAAWMLLRSATGTTPEPLAARVARAVQTPAPAEALEPPPLWRLLQNIPGLREQEQAFEIVRETHGDAWPAEVLTHIVHAPSGMARIAVESLVAAGRQAELARAYGNLLARPARNPALLVALAERFEGGVIRGEAGGPSQRVQGLLHLAVYLCKEAPGNSVLTRTRQRLVDLLKDGEPPLFARLLADSDRSILRALFSSASRGIHEQLDTPLMDYLLERLPELARERERPFWDLPAIWTTRIGLERRSSELRVIKEQKLPANAEAIGRAASYGDLSENSEWSAAIEEQRTLTQAAMDIEKELARAALLETAALPVGVVAPGTRVRVRDVGRGQVLEYKVLGPWDTGEDLVISYKAPLAAGILGRRAGERARVQLPSGEIELEVLEVEPLPLV